MHAEPVSDNERLVIEFFDSMGQTFDVMRAAFERYLSDDCVWANVGMPTVSGKSEVLRFLDEFAGAIGLEGVGGKVLHVASRDNLVLTERHERWTGANGVVLVESLPVMGTFEVRDGKIAAWRDYFDPSNFAHLTSTEGE